MGGWVGVSLGGVGMSMVVVVILECISICV